MFAACIAMHNLDVEALYVKSRVAGSVVKYRYVVVLIPQVLWPLMVPLGVCLVALMFQTLQPFASVLVQHQG